MRCFQGQGIEKNNSLMDVYLKRNLALCEMFFWSSIGGERMDVMARY